MVAEVMSQRSWSWTRCAVLGFGGIAALAQQGLQHAFFAPQNTHQVPQLHVQGDRLAVPSAQQSARSALGGAEGSWAAPVLGLLGLGAALAVAVGSRDEARTAMRGKHDRRTFRGKIHAHTFGKYRLRPEKLRKIRLIKNGKYDPENAVQYGQPEPDHPWDLDNLLENPMYTIPQYMRDAYGEFRDQIWDMKRTHWKEFMGKKGKQHAFKNWTPPELVEAGAGGVGGE